MSNYEGTRFLHVHDSDVTVSHSCSELNATVSRTRETMNPQIDISRVPSDSKLSESEISLSCSQMDTTFESNSRE